MQKNLKIKNSELGRKNIAEFKEADKIPILIILDNIRSLHNIGSVFRTSDAFLIEKIYLCGITATPPHKNIHKTALGATETVDWEYKKDTLALVKELQSTQVDVIAVEQAEGSVSLENLEISSLKRTAFVFGNEVKGVAQEVVSGSDKVVEIPQYGTKHSLNIATSAGIVIWEAFCKYAKTSL
ncbi:RNA methyltransferase [Aquimarina sp. ERC-38]|uniref:RNA methyltransferase n=1 Tax=Aquimarina sp. ERC-38 TaxID=2949996 RepID=UPI002246FA27|nr:RNA methyltransferase [Aquimarina sp. ERC-38]UZO81158.1 RNA methyltransferase [Aquimarina sp. ERC-38]